MSKKTRRKDQAIGMDVEIDSSTAIVAIAPTRPPAEVNNPINPEPKPYCKRHNVLMIASASTEVATLYRCRVKGCTEKGAKLRPNVRAPNEPLMCPQCRVACEVDLERANFGGSINLRMVCPECQFAVDVPRPDASQIMSIQQRRAAAPDLRDIATGGF